MAGASIAARRWRVASLFLHVLLPIVVGGTVYLCWRPASLLMFSWVENLGLTALVGAMRLQAEPLGPHVPYLVRFVLPDALWAYSLASAMRLLWLSADNRALALAWTALGPCLAVGGELGQWTSLVPGVFDPLDLAACAIALPLALILIPNNGHTS